MKCSSQRKLRSQARTVVVQQLTNREPSSQRRTRQQSISPIQHNINASFHSVSSIPIEDFNIVQIESSNVQSQPSDSSEHSSEDNYSNLIFSHSGSSYYSFSRSSSLSLSRGNSFIGTELANNRSRASSPFIVSETSSEYNSETTYHSAISSANQSYVSYNVNDDNSSNEDSYAGSFRQLSQLSGVQLLESSAASVAQEESEASPSIGDERNNAQVHIENMNQHLEFIRHSLNRVKFNLQEVLDMIIWMILNLYRIILKYLFEPVCGKINIIMTMISPRNVNINSTMMTGSNNAFRAQLNLIKWLYSSTRNNWMFYAGMAMIIILLYYIPCNLTNLQNLEFAECMPKIHGVFRQNGNLSSSTYDSFDSLNDDIEFEQNDLLIRDVVADQVKTVCAAEVQKRIPPQNYDLVRYRDNHVSDEIVVDIVRQEIKKVVEEMLHIYSQDKLNKADFALSTGGAKIISPLTSPTYEQWPVQWYKVAFAKLTGHGITRGKPPVTALQPDVHVGQCWPFAGQKGQLAVLLSRQIYVTAVTYDHVSKTVAMGITSAPKEFEIWGFADDDSNVPSAHKPDNEHSSEHSEHTNIISNSYLTDESGSIASIYGQDLNLGSSPNHLFFGRFVYDINGSPVQTFEVNRLNRSIRAIIMKVKSNWDNPLYTCLYRFRVHGVRPDIKNQTS